MEFGCTKTELVNFRIKLDIIDARSELNRLMCSRDITEDVLLVTVIIIIIIVIEKTFFIIL